MEALLLGIYCFFVWLIFIKFKLLPWTTPFKVAVAIIPVVALATMMLLLNIFAPTTADVRVVKYVVPIVSQVRGKGTSCFGSTRRLMRPRFVRSKRKSRRMRRRSGPTRPGWPRCRRVCPTRRRVSAN
jgi:hypothetical protein